MKKSLKIAKVATLLFIYSFILYGCASARTPMILEHSYTSNFKVIPEIRGGKEGLRITGLSGHSSYAVKNIEVKTNDNDPTALEVLVYLVKPDGNLSGSFNKWFPVESSISIVYYGNNKKIIWRN